MMVECIKNRLGSAKQEQKLQYITLQKSYISKEALTVSVGKSNSCPTGNGAPNLYTSCLINATWNRLLHQLAGLPSINPLDNPREAAEEQSTDNASLGR